MIGEHCPKRILNGRVRSSNLISSISFRMLCVKIQYFISLQEKGNKDRDIINLKMRRVRRRDFISLQEKGERFYQCTREEREGEKYYQFIREGVREKDFISLQEEGERIISL